MKDEKNWPYKVLDNGMILLVLDYAKERDPRSGKYKKIIYETQYLPWSNLGGILDDKDSEGNNLQTDTVVTKLFGKKMRYIDHLGVAQTGTAFDTFHEIYEDKVLPPALRAEIDVIYYHSLDFNMSRNQIHFRAQHQLDPIAKFLGTDKVCQRLWLHGNKSLHQFLPPKIMVAMGSDIESNINRLADNIIRFCGEGRHIFLKSPGDALGAGNVNFKIKNKKDLIEKLQSFYEGILKANPNTRFLIEIASTIGQSDEKNRFDTYRAAIALTMKGSAAPSVRIINLWRFMARSGEFDSHEYDRVQYYAEPVPYDYSFKTKEVKELAPEKIAKHLDLQKSKPDLFNGIRQFALSLTEGDLYQITNCVPVFSKSDKSARMVFSSKAAKKATLRQMQAYTKAHQALRESFQESLGCSDPIGRLADRAKALQPGRDWELIARAATVLLKSNQPEAQILSQMRQLVGIDKNVAESAAHKILRPKPLPEPQKLSKSVQGGIFASKAQNPPTPPRENSCSIS